MAGAFRLTLDTHAPVLTWGAIGGADAGGLLQVAYTVNEPGVDSAVLELQDGRVLAMSVLPDRLEVLVPFDATSQARITAVTVDDLDNLATYTLDIAITGGVGAPPTPLASRGVAPMPTGPSRRTSERTERRVDSRSRARIASTTRVTTRREQHDRVVVRSATVVGRPVLTSTAKATLVSTSQHRARGAHATIATATSRSGVVRRRDGLELTLLLDLL